MALVGALLLVFIIFIRPQEFVPALESLSILNLAALIAMVGIAIDVGTGKLKSMWTPQLPFLAGFAVWCFIATMAKVGFSEARDIKITFPILFMLLVLYSVTFFERFRAMAILILTIALSLSIIGDKMASNDAECIKLEEDTNGEVAHDKASGQPIGLPCENYRECNKKLNDYKSEFLCEKAGPFDTFSVGEGRVRWRGILADPNELSLAIGAAVSFAFAIHAAAKKKVKHLFLVGAVALATSCVVQTGSRGGVLVLLAIFATYFVRRYGVKGLVLAAAFAAPALLLGGREGEEAESSSLERLGALYEGVDFFRQTPIFGLGFGQFTENYFITAHNSYLLSAAELGFPGMVLWSTLVYVSIKIPYTIAISPPADMDTRILPYAFALTTSFAGILVGIFFLSFTYHAMLFIYFGLSGALYLAARRSSPTFEVKIAPKEIAYVAGVDAMLLSFLFVYTRIKGAP